MVRKKSPTARRVHTGLRLDEEIFERLSGSERGVSEEIRERLERTFREDDLDAATRELCSGIVNIAKMIRVDFGTEWHDYPRAHQAFAAAAARRIAGYAPRREAPPVASDLLHYGPNDEPETIGRMRERDDQRAHDYPHLRTAQETTAKRRQAAAGRHIRGKE